MKLEYKWMALSVTTIGALLSVLDGSIFIVALPNIMQSLQCDLLTITWVIMGYLFIITILTPAFGRIADIIGRKKLYIYGFIIFTSASLFCATSQSGIELLLFRMIQAIGGSLLIANGAAIVTDSFPKKELGKALGINGIAVGIASAIGPPLGGLLIGLGWRFIFFMNLPIGIIGTIWGWMQLKEVAKLPKKQTFDWAGTILFGFGMLMLLISLSFGDSIGWESPILIILIVGSLGLLIIFARTEAKAKQPLMDPQLFKSSLVSYALISGIFNCIARGAVTFLLTFYFQIILELTPVWAGIYLTPFAIATIVMAPLSGNWADKYGSRGLTIWGLIISAVGLFGLMFMTTSTPTIELLLWMLLIGIGSGMFFSPNSKSIMEVMPPHRRGMATSVRSMLLNAGSVISMGIAFALLSSAISSDALTRLFLGTQVGSSGVTIAGFMDGLHLIFLISFIATLIAAAISALKGKPPQWKQEDLAITQETNREQEAPVLTEDFGL
jgi:EmrB/QacA subfamily drug resistance transporter